MYLCNMRYRIDMKYDGAPFCGWQIQPSAPSVQEALQQALSTLLGGQVEVTGAGRTDTGVNASRYVAHFDAASPVINCADLRYRLNAILPEAVAIERIVPAAESFHARFDATRREYLYFLHRKKDPFVGRYSYLYTYPELDFGQMNLAAGALLGRHDFSCFEKSGTDTRTSVCTVFEARWEPYTPTLPGLSGGDTESRDYWVFRIAADRFLRNMVRAIVGTLLEVGRGRRSPESIAEIAGPVLAEGETPSGEGRSSRRSLAGESAPGHALFLSQVDYG